eukprot:3038689-Rhodomonas_salina.1
MCSKKLLEHSSAKVAASDRGKGSLQHICARRAFQPIQHLCCTKHWIWTPARCMRSGMLLGHVGAKEAAAASDGHAASSKGLLQQICARRAFPPIQHLCHTKQLIWSLTRVMRSGML